MKSFNETNNNAKIPLKIDSVNFLAKKPKENKCRIIEVKLNDSQLMTNDTDLFIYGKWKCDETGYYNINSQCCVNPEVITDVKMFQFGFCDETQEEFSQAANSHCLNTKISELLCYTFTTAKKLEKDKMYISWMKITTATTENLEQLNYVKEFSRLTLIKL